MDPTGVNGNWWVGLSIMHRLFAHEHNAICAMLAKAHPHWDDARLFATARRVNAAVMAKIHTVEWTATMAGVLARHMPALAGVVADVRNPFAPWDDPANRRSGSPAPFAPAEAP